MTKERPFHVNATPIVFGYANALKREMTEAETILWGKLRARRLNELKFRRQHPVGKFILDFYCHELKLAVEIDGSIHTIDEIQERDAGRTYMLKEWEITVMRFTNEEVLNNIDFVLKTIQSFNKQ